MRKPPNPYIYELTRSFNQEMPSGAEKALAVPLDQRPLKAQVLDFIQRVGLPPKKPDTLYRRAAVTAPAQPEEVKDSGVKYSLAPEKSPPAPPISEEIDRSLSQSGQITLGGGARYSVDPEAGRTGTAAAPRPAQRLPDQWKKEYSHWQFSQDSLPTFREFILDCLRRRNLEPVQFYTRADLDRKLFSRMKNEAGYHPSKETAIRCCLALRLDISLTEHALALAGYSLSWSMKEDLAVRWCIQHGIYRVHEVMEVVEELQASPR